VFNLYIALSIYLTLYCIGKQLIDDEFKHLKKEDLLNGLISKKDEFLSIVR
jgi:hypothetical protein